jgi:hypothetical protein
MAMAKLAGNIVADAFDEPALQQRFKQGPRAAESGPGKLEWQASMALLAAAFDSGEHVNLSPSLYWAGWVWTGFVKWSAADVGAEGKTLGMFSTVSTPALLGLPEEPVGVTADVQFGMGTSAPMPPGAWVRGHSQPRYMHFSEKYWGLANMQLLPIVPTAEAVVVALAPHLRPLLPVALPVALPVGLPVGLSVSNVL